MAGEPLGEARIDFIGDTTKLKASAKEAEVIAQKAVADVNASANGSPASAGSAALNATAENESVARSVGGIAQEANTATRSVHRFFGTFAAAAGIAATMYTLGKAIREGVIAAFESGADKAERFKLSLDMSDTHGTIVALSKELETLQSRVALMSSEAEESVDTFYQTFREKLRGNTLDSLKEQARTLEVVLASMRAADNVTALRQHANRDIAQSQAAADLQRFERIKSQEQRELDGEKFLAAERKKSTEDGDQYVREEADRRRRESEEDLDYRIAKEQEYYRILQDETRALEQQASIRSRIIGQAASQFGADNVVLDSLNRIQETLEIIASQRRGEVM